MVFSFKQSWVARKLRRVADVPLERLQVSDEDAEQVIQRPKRHHLHGSGWYIEVPEDGIPARQGNTPGKADCDTWYINPDEDREEWTDSAGSVVQQTVYNLTDQEIKYDENDPYRLCISLYNRPVIIEPAPAVGSMTGFLVECMAKCDQMALVRVYNPQWPPGGTDGNSGCGKGNFLRLLNLHNSTTAFPELDFQGLPYLEVPMFNRWRKYAAQDSAVLFNRVSSRGLTAYQFEIVEAEDQIAEIIWGTYKGDGEIAITGYDRGIDPEECGQVVLDNLPFCEEETVDTEIFCEHLPQRSSRTVQRYRITSTISALMGKPIELNVLDAGDSPGNGPQAGANCTLTFPAIKHYGWICGLEQPDDKTVEPVLSARTVLVGVQTSEASWIFNTEIHYVCDWEEGVDITIEGIDCVSTSSSSS